MPALKLVLDLIAARLYTRANCNGDRQHWGLSPTIRENEQWQN